MSSKNFEQTGEYVKLNVGGSLFYTTIGTLKNEPESMLSAMFSGRMEVKTDSEGWVLIDRCGKHFRVILNYLRDGEVPLPDGKLDLSELLVEAKFYCLESFCKTIDARIARIPTDDDDLSLSKANIVIVKDSRMAKSIISSTPKPVVKLTMNRYNNVFSYTRMFGCKNFPQYCVASQHDDPAVCTVNMMAYYGRRGSYACPSCFAVFKGEFNVFVAEHKSHLGQFRGASKISILSKTVSMPPPTVIPPLRLPHQNENAPVQSTSAAAPERSSIFQIDLSSLTAPHPPHTNLTSPHRLNTRFSISPAQTYTPYGKIVDLDKDESQERRRERRQEEQIRSPSFGDESSSNGDEKLTEALNSLNENFKAFAEQSQQERDIIIKCLQEELKEKERVEDALIKVQEETKSLISSLVKMESQEKEIISLRKSLAEEKAGNDKRRKEEEEKREKEHMEKEKRRKEEEEKREKHDMEKELQEEQRERERERRSKEVTMEAIEEWHRREGERKRQQMRDEEESHRYMKKRKH